MENIIISIISAVIGVAFLGWGIYQLKTGKMVAKRSKYPVDEPRQVGVLFLMLSFVAFWFTVVAGFNELIPNFDIAIANYILMIALSIFVVSIVCYGLKKHRIFGVKNTANVAKYVKKYYVIVNLTFLLCLIDGLAMNFFCAYLPFFMTIVFTLIMMVGLAVIATMMTYIECKAAATPKRRTRKA